MDPLIATALDTARARGAEYADIRLVANREQRIVVRNGVVETMTADESVGLGIRAVVQGAWGFASTRELTGEAADQAAAQAVQIARASASQNGAGMTAVQLLGSPVSSRGSYVTPITVDPFTVPLEDKLAPAAGGRIGRWHWFRRSRRGWPTWSSSGGAHLRQHRGGAGDADHLRSWRGVQATAVGNGEIQRRSYPQSHGRQQGCAGWEYVVAMDLPGNARRTAEEAAELLTAEPCPSNIHTDLIIDSSQLALQIHESCGHAVELDPGAGRRGRVRRDVVPDA